MAEEDGRESMEGRERGIEREGTMLGSGERGIGGVAGEQQQEAPWQPLKGYEMWSVDLTKLYLGQKVASGSYGRVYRGNYKERMVAVKILREPENEEEKRKLEKHFNQEVAMFARLSHPNIVEFIGACQKPPLYMVITEFLSKGTLRSFLHGLEGRLPTHEVVALALDIAQGMAYLQKEGVIHRDLKSDNLILAEDGRVKVVDFGVSRLADQRVEMTAEMGTYRWMAPEMIEHKSYNDKVDVYSFGIVLWEIITGELPFSGMTAVQAAFAVVNRNARPPVPEYGAAELVSLMQQCWHANPDSRPSFLTIVATLQKQQMKIVADPQALHSFASFKAARPKGCCPLFSPAR